VNVRRRYDNNSRNSYLLEAIILPYALTIVLVGMSIALCFRRCTSLQPSKQAFILTTKIALRACDRACAEQRADLLATRKSLRSCVRQTRVVYDAFLNSVVGASVVDANYPSVHPWIGGKYTDPLRHTARKPRKNELQSVRRWFP